MIKQVLKMMSGNAPNCKKVDNFLMDYLDGQLDSKTAKSFEEHIDMCEGCKAYVKEYKETVLLLQKIEKPEAPQELADLTLEFLRSQSK